MPNREPSSVSLLAARIARAYPSLSAYSSATLAEQLCAIERMQRRHAERQCSGPRDVRVGWRFRGEVFGYCKAVPLPEGRAVDPTAPRGMTWTDDPDAEARAAKRIARAAGGWLNHLVRLLTSRDFDSVDDRLRAENRILAEVSIEGQGDPRGAVLKLRLPGESEASGV